jgi:hypothetical protein
MRIGFAPFVMIARARRRRVAGMPETIQPHILVVDDDPQIRELL